MSKLHLDSAAEKEANDIGRKFMNSSDVVGDMSRAYGADLSSVKLHTDESAAAQAADRGVDAFSTGRDVFFARGAFDQSDPASRGLLAHELSHSLQQGVGGEMGGMAQSAPMGAAQGGLLDWFRDRKARKREEKERAADFAAARQALQKHGLESNLDPDADMELEVNQNNNYLKYIKEQEEKAFAEEMADITANGGMPGAAFVPGPDVSTLPDNGPFDVMMGTSLRNFRSKDSYSLYNEVMQADPEKLKSADLRARVLADFNTNMNSRIKDAESRTGGDPTKTSAETFRLGSGELLSFSKVLGGFMPAGYELEIGKRMKEGGTEGAFGYLQEIMNEAPELQDYLGGASSAFEGTTSYGGNTDLQAELMMNNMILRSVAPAMTAAPGNMQRELGNRLARRGFSAKRVNRYANRVDVKSPVQQSVALQKAVGDKRAGPMGTAHRGLLDTFKNLFKAKK